MSDIGDITSAAIETNLVALAEILLRASTLADMATKAMATGNRNLAIGTVLPLEQDLPTAIGLLTAILALHRRPRIGSLFNAQPHVESKKLAQLARPLFWRSP